MVGERVGLSLATSEDVGATEGADDGEGVDKVSAIDTVAGLLCSLMLFTNLGIKIPIPAADARMAESLSGRRLSLASTASRSAKRGHQINCEVEAHLSQTAGDPWLSACSFWACQRAG